MPQWIIDLFARYGYAALFAGVFLENLGIPVPGETVLLAAGFFAKEGTLRLAIVIPCAIAAAILGDNFGYWIGRGGGRKFVDRYGRYIALSPRRLSKAEKYFRENGPRTIFIARFISGLRVVAAIAAGVTRVPWPTFLLYNSAGAIAWGTTIALLGYLFGKSWSLLEHWVGGAGLVLVALVAAVVLFVVLRRHRQRIVARVTDWLPGSVTLQEAWLIAVSMIAIGLIGKITEDVVTRESTRFDEVISQWITSIDLPGMHALMLFGNGLGSGVAIVSVTLIAIVWRWRRGDRRAAAIMTGLAVLTQVLDAIFKMSVHRVRPEALNAYTQLYAASFPSGHAMNAIAAYGFLAVLIARERPRLRRVAFIAVVVFSLLIGVARIYLRLHWPTDVLGGYCVGLLLLSIAVFWLDRVEGERDSSR